MFGGAFKNGTKSTCCDVSSLEMTRSDPAPEWEHTVVVYVPSVQRKQVRERRFAQGHFDLTCVRHILTVDAIDLSTVWHDVSCPVCSRL